MSINHLVDHIKRGEKKAEKKTDGLSLNFLFTIDEHQDWLQLKIKIISRDGNFHPSSNRNIMTNRKKNFVHNFNNLFYLK